MKYDEKLSKTKCYTANLIERNNLEQNEHQNQSNDEGEKMDLEVI